MDKVACGISLGKMCAVHEQHAVITAGQEHRRRGARAARTNHDASRNPVKVSAQ